MNRGKLLASGTVQQVREQLGSNERTVTIRLLGNPENAASWLQTHASVVDLQVSDAQVHFGFRGSDEAQADLITGLIEQGVRLTAFEEKRSSFEDILVEVAESNRSK